MAVVSAATMTLKPGGYAAFTELHKKSKAILERCGAKNVRLLGTLVAGQASASIACRGKQKTTQPTVRSWTSSWLTKVGGPW